MGVNYPLFPSLDEGYTISQSPSCLAGKADTEDNLQTITLTILNEGTNLIINYRIYHAKDSNPYLSSQPSCTFRGNDRPQRRRICGLFNTHLSVQKRPALDPVHPSQKY